MNAKHTPDNALYAAVEALSAEGLLNPNIPNIGGVCMAALRTLQTQPLIAAAPEMYAVLREFARLRTGPTSKAHAKWVANVLKLAENARAALKLAGEEK